MIRHIVLFKMNAGAEDKTEELATALKGLKGKIPLVKELEVGIDIGRKGKSYDVSLNSTFDSMADVEEYAVHPEHVAVVEFINSVCQGVVKVDYEI